MTLIKSYLCGPLLFDLSHKNLPIASFCIRYRLTRTHRITVVPHIPAVSENGRTVFELYRIPIAGMRGITVSDFGSTLIRKALSTKTSLSAVFE